MCAFWSTEHYFAVYAYKHCDQGYKGRCGFTCPILAYKQKITGPQTQLQTKFGRQLIGSASVPPIVRQLEWHAK